MKMVLALLAMTFLATACVSSPTKSTPAQQDNRQSMEELMSGG